MEKVGLQRGGRGLLVTVCLALAMPSAAGCASLPKKDPDQSQIRYQLSVATADPNTQTVDNGGTATFTITVLNTGDVALTNVVVTDALSPNCNKTIGTLAPGQSVSYKCTRPNVTKSFTNVGVVTGQAGSTTLTAQDSARVTARAPFVPKVVPKVVSHKKPKATG